MIYYKEKQQEKTHKHKVAFTSASFRFVMCGRLRCGEFLAEIAPPEACDNAMAES